MLRRFLVAALAFTAVGCASNPTGAVLGPAPSLPSLVRVNAADVDTLLFLGVAFPIDGSALGGSFDGFMKVRQATIYGDAELASTYRGWSVEVGNSLLAAAGYPIRRTSKLFAQFENYDGVRYALGGTATDLSLDMYGALAGDRTEARVRIEWEMLDVSTREVRFSGVTSGRAETGGQSGDAVHVAIERALASLLADSSMSISMVRPSGDAAVATATSANWKVPAPTEGALIRLTPDQANVATGATLFERAAPAVVSVVGSRASGTAFLITRDGLALTNHHVIRAQSSLVALNHKGDTLAVRVLRSDSAADVALIQVGCGPTCATVFLAEDLPPVGEEILVIGTPLDASLSYSASRGIVSGVRRIEGVTSIQTDAAINHGNSGGPMLNEAGQVVGIIAWKVAAEGVEGIGFGIEIGDALNRLGIRR